MTTSDWLFGLAVRVPMRAVGAPVGALASPPPGPLGLPHDEQARQASWEAHTEQRWAGRGGRGRGASCIGDCLGGSQKKRRRQRLSGSGF